MNWLAFGVQWLHVLLGIFWFGTVLYVDFVIIPAVSDWAPERVRELTSRLGARGSRIMRVVIPTIIVLGLVRGTVFGPVQSFDALMTAYGITWLVALAFTVGLWVWGVRIYEPALRAVGELPLAADGSITPAIEAATNRVKRLAGLEVLAFFVIFTCMILMRFGM